MLQFRPHSIWAFAGSVWQVDCSPMQAAAQGAVRSIRFEPEHRDEACITLVDGTMFTLSSASGMQVHTTEERLVCLKDQIQVSPHFDSELCPECLQPMQRAIVRAAC